MRTYGMGSRRGAKWCFAAFPLNWCINSTKQLAYKQCKDDDKV